MNYWYKTSHWDYDRKNLCFIEISDSKEHDGGKEFIEEPRPGSVIKIMDSIRAGYVTGQNLFMKTVIARRFI